MKPFKFGSKKWQRRFNWFFRKCGYKRGQEMEAGFYFMVFQSRNITLKQWLGKQNIN